MSPSPSLSCTRPAKAHHGRRGCVEVRPDEIAPILGVELGRDAGRTDKVAKKDGDRPPFGRLFRRRLGPGWSGRAQTRDRLQEALAVPEIDAQLRQVAIGQIRQNVGVDRVVAEGGLVPAETEAPQPNRDVHCEPPFVHGKDR
jgi:hypothetical protein